MQRVCVCVAEAVGARASIERACSLLLSVIGTISSGEIDDEHECSGKERGTERAGTNGANEMMGRKCGQRSAQGPVSLLVCGFASLIMPCE